MNIYQDIYIRHRVLAQKLVQRGIITREEMEEAYQTAVAEEEAAEKATKAAMTLWQLLKYFWTRPA